MTRKTKSGLIILALVAVLVVVSSCLQRPTSSAPSPDASATASHTSTPRARATTPTAKAATTPTGRKASRTPTAAGQDPQAPGGYSTASRPRPGATDPESGLPWIDAADLPAEARDTLKLIDRGGPFPYDKDGSVFGNFERVLPQESRGFYREYTVKTPGSSDRGARRIVTGDGDRIFYWTQDHYASFARIRR